MKTDKKPGRPTAITLRILPARNGAYEVRDQDGKLLGISQNYMMAVWTAVAAAEETSKSGIEARVVASRGGKDFEEFVAKPVREVPSA
jgi:hypothetical protein